MIGVINLESLACFFLLRVKACLTAVFVAPFAIYSKIKSSGAEKRGVAFMYLSFSIYIDRVYYL